jgi:hypothetical protein
VDFDIVDLVHPNLIERSDMTKVLDVVPKGLSNVTMKQRPDR